MIIKTQIVVNLPATPRSPTSHTHTIAIRYATPDHTPTTHVAILACGLGIPTGYYTPFFNALANQGWAVIAADPPGQGDSKPAISTHHNYGYHYLATSLLPQLANTAHSLFQPHKTIYIGHSVGGHWLLSHLAHHRPDLTDHTFAGIALIASGSAHWRSYKTTTGLHNLTRAHAANFISNKLGLFPGDSLGLGARQPAQLMQDWALMTQTGRLADVTGQEASSLRRFAGPVLALDFAEDRVSPASSVDALLDLVPQATVTRTHMADPVGHTRWAREPDSVVRALTQWVDRSPVQEDSGSSVGDEVNAVEELDVVAGVPEPARRVVRPEGHVIRLDDVRLPKQATNRRSTRSK